MAFSSKELATPLGDQNQQAANAARWQFIVGCGAESILPPDAICNSGTDRRQAPIDLREGIQDKANLEALRAVLQLRLDEIDLELANMPVP